MTWLVMGRGEEKRKRLLNQRLGKGQTLVKPMTASGKWYSLAKAFLLVRRPERESWRYWGSRAKRKTWHS